jgi:CDP-glucose 4,6-dehydratase
MALANFLKGKSVFLTGHTGFKGSWLCHVLKTFGAEITGFSLPAVEKCHFISCETEAIVNHIIGDINSYPDLETAMLAADPDIVIHMAAQPLVRLSYEQPLETMQTNIMGTANVLASALKCNKNPIFACVTSDKCYENFELETPYKETDRMGGRDPYSASKGAAELVAASFAKSFYMGRNQSILTLRGGNVVGGGDWSKDRIMTDIVSALSNHTSPIIRNPSAIRPWQHVLDVLQGYLVAIEQVAELPNCCFEQFNIGPETQNEASVETLAAMACSVWGEDIRPEIIISETELHEAKLLRLDVSKAAEILNWRPKYGLSATVSKTIEWYRAELGGASMSAFTERQIFEYFHGEKISV